MASISLLVVASLPSLSSRNFPVNLGNRMANPESGRTEPKEQVWIGDNVISAPRTSSTRRGMNQKSASIFESTR